jgi:hypothetical protein
MFILKANRCKLCGSRWRKADHVLNDLTFVGKVAVGADKRRICAKCWDDFPEKFSKKS